MLATRIGPSQDRCDASKAAPRSTLLTAAPCYLGKAVEETLRSAGRPLEEPTRAFFGERMGHNFRDVRVHDDARAAESAKAVGARAYTLGRHVVFGAGAFAPGTAAGDRLLAHELGHVVEQDGRATDPGAPMRIAPPDSAGERQADDRAARALTGQAPIRSSSAAPSGPVLQRQPEEEERKLPEASGGQLAAPGPGVAQPGQGASGGPIRQGPGGTTGSGKAGTWSKDLLTMAWYAYNPEKDWSLAWLRGNGSEQDFTPALKPAVVRSPPQEWAFHTSFVVDSYSAPIPDSMKVFYAAADVKFVTASGKTTLDKHYSDPSPTYFAPANELGLNHWQFRTLLPISEPGTLDWTLHLSVGKGGDKRGLGISARKSITFEIKP